MLTLALAVSLLSGTVVTPEPLPVVTPAPVAMTAPSRDPNLPFVRIGFRAGPHGYRVPPTATRFEEKDSAVAPGYALGMSAALRLRQLPTYVVADLSFRHGSYRVPEEDAEVRFGSGTGTLGMRAEIPLTERTRAQVETGAGLFLAELAVDRPSWEDDAWTNSLSFEAYGASALAFRGPRTVDVVVEGRLSSAPGLIDYGGLSVTAGIVNRF